MSHLIWDSSVNANSPLSNDALQTCCCILNHVTRFGRAWLQNTLVYKKHFGPPPPLWLTVGIQCFHLALFGFDPSIQAILVRFSLNVPSQRFSIQHGNWGLHSQRLFGFIFWDLSRLHTLCWPSCRTVDFKLFGFSFSFCAMLQQHQRWAIPSYIYQSNLLRKKKKNTLFLKHRNYTWVI